MRWIEDVIACRRWPMGWHTDYCPNSCTERIRYHSCRNRSCAQCRAYGDQVHIERWNAKLLDVSSYHTVISAKDWFRPLFFANYELVADAMFKACNETFAALYADPEYCGGVAGFVAFLHTHNRRLQRHVHLHIFSTGGALNGDEWVENKRDILFPQFVVRDLYTQRFAKEIKRLIESDKLYIPKSMGDLDPGFAYDDDKKEHERLWRATIMPRRDTGASGIKYGIRYGRGCPIGDSRIESFDGKTVTFRLDKENEYEPHEEGFGETETLDAVEFINRYMDHIPPRRYHTNRPYGIYAGGAGKKLEVARHAIRQAPRQPPKRVNFDHLNRCPECKAVLKARGEVPSALRSFRQRKGWMRNLRQLPRGPPDVTLLAA